MGAWNYGTSDFITLAFNPDCYETNTDVDPESEDYVDDDTASMWASDDEGCQLKLGFNRCYFDIHERKQARAEAKQLKKMLHELAGIGMVVTYPGWCPAWFSYTETKEKIKKAVDNIHRYLSLVPSAQSYYKKSWGERDNIYHRLKKIAREVA